VGGPVVERRRVLQFIIHVSVLIVKDGRVLLVREAGPSGQGKWNLPGGHLEPGEKLADGAAREVEEETGLSITLTGLVGVYTGLLRAAHLMNCVYAGSPVGDEEAVPGCDQSECGWFTPERALRLPDVDVLNPSKLRAVLADHARGRCVPLDFVSEWL